MNPEKRRIARQPIHSAKYDPNGPFPDYEAKSFEVEFRKQFAKVGIDELEVKMWEQPARMVSMVSAKLVAQLYKDKTHHETEKNRETLQVPWGLWGAIGYKFLGEKFLSTETMPQWLPQWAKRALLVKTKWIVTRWETETFIEYIRSCPHMGKGGHGAFLFGEELGLGESHVRDQLRETALRGSLDALDALILDLATDMARAGLKATTVALGRVEYANLCRLVAISDTPHHKEVWEQIRGGGDLEQFAGLKIERIQRQNYISIY